MKGDRHKGPRATHWTKQDRAARLLKARREGVSVPDLAVRFGVSESAVIGKLWRMRRSNQR